MYTTLREHSAFLEQVKPPQTIFRAGGDRDVKTDFQRTEPRRSSSTAEGVASDVSAAARDVRASRRRPGAESKGPCCVLVLTTPGPAHLCLLQLSQGLLPPRVWVTLIQSDRGTLRIPEGSTGHHGPARGTSLHFCPPFLSFIFQSLQKCLFTRSFTCLSKRGTILSGGSCQGLVLMRGSQKPTWRSVGRSVGRSGFLLMSVSAGRLALPRGRGCIAVYLLKCVRAVV